MASKLFLIFLVLSLIIWETSSAVIPWNNKLSGNVKWWVSGEKWSNNPNNEKWNKNPSNEKWNNNLNNEKWNKNPNNKKWNNKVLEWTYIPKGYWSHNPNNKSNKWANKPYGDSTTLRELGRR